MNFLNSPDTDETQNHLSKLGAWLKGDFNKAVYMTNHMVGLLKEGCAVENAIKETLKAFGGDRRGFDKFIMTDVVQRLVSELDSKDFVERDLEDAKHKLDQYEDSGIIKVLKRFKLLVIKPRRHE